MIAILFGLGLGHAAPSVIATGPHDASVGAARDDEDRRRKRSQEDTRPRGRALEMGPAATGLAMAAFLAALVVRARRRHQA